MYGLLCCGQFVGAIVSFGTGAGLLSLNCATTGGSMVVAALAQDVAVVVEHK